MANARKILITGDTGEREMVLVNRILENGTYPEHMLKIIDTHIYGISENKGYGFRYSKFLLLIKGNYNEIEKVEKTIKYIPFNDYRYKQDNRCDTVIYSVPDVYDSDNKSSYDQFVSFVDISKASGIKLFIYTSNIGKDPSQTTLTECSTVETQCEEYLQKTATKDFVVVTIKPSVYNGCFTGSISCLSLNILTNNMIRNCKIPVFCNRQKRPERYNEIFVSLHCYLLNHSVEKILAGLRFYIVSFRSHINAFYIFRKVLRFMNFKKRLKGRSLGSLKESVDEKILMCTIRRLFELFMMTLLLHVWPEQTYRFSTRKLLPDRSRRIKLGDSFTFPYELIESKTSDIPKVKELNIVLRGDSFDINDLKKLDPPIYLASFSNPIDTEVDVVYVSTPVVILSLKAMGKKVLVVDVYQRDCEGGISIPYLITKSGQSKAESEKKAAAKQMYEETQYCRRIAILENIYRPATHFHSKSWPPSGSGLGMVCALSYIAKKINIYGWDFHMTSSPQDMSYLQVLRSLYQLKIDKKSRYQFESAMINFYYAYHLSKMPNINIHGYLGHLSKHKKLIDRIERVLFN